MAHYRDPNHTKRTRSDSSASAEDYATNELRNCPLPTLLLKLGQVVHHRQNSQYLTNGQPGKGFRLQIQQMDNFVTPIMPTSSTHQSLEKLNRDWAQKCGEILTEHYTEAIPQIMLLAMEFPHQQFREARIKAKERFMMKFTDKHIATETHNEWNYYLDHIEEAQRQHMQQDPHQPWDPSMFLPHNLRVLQRPPTVPPAVETETTNRLTASTPPRPRDLEQPQMVSTSSTLRPETMANQTPDLLRAQTTMQDDPAITATLDSSDDFLQLTQTFPDANPNSAQNDSDNPQNEDIRYNSPDTFSLQPTAPAKKRHKRDSTMPQQLTQGPSNQANTPPRVLPEQPTHPLSPPRQQPPNMPLLLKTPRQNKRKGTPHKRTPTLIPERRPNNGNVQHNLEETLDNYQLPQHREPLEVKGDSNVLSNFYHCTIPYRGRNWHSLEQAYQYDKCFYHEKKNDPDCPFTREKNSIMNLIPPRISQKSKGAARQVKHLLTDTWQNQERITVMKRLLKIKFAMIPEFRNTLLSTEGRTLTHPLEDDFWGHLHGRGQDMFARLLMELRDDKILLQNLPDLQSKLEIPEPRMNVHYALNGRKYEWKPPVINRNIWIFGDSNLKRLHKDDILLGAQVDSYPGAKIRHMTKLLEKITQEKNHYTPNPPKYVIINIGINDRGERPHNIRKDIQALVSATENAFPSTTHTCILPVNCTFQLDHQSRATMDTLNKYITEATRHLQNIRTTTTIPNPHMLPPDYIHWTRMTARDIIDTAFLDLGLNRFQQHLFH